MKIKKGDMVVVLTGDDKGPAGRRVLSVIDGGKQVVVEGVNRATRHVRKGHPKSPQGGRLQIELPIDASNVQVLCPNCSKASRLGVRYNEEGAKERFCKKCDGSLGAISPPRPQYSKQS